MLRRQVLASCLYGSVLSVSFFILRCVYYFFFFPYLRSRGLIQSPATSADGFWRVRTRYELAASANWPEEMQPFCPEQRATKNGHDIETGLIADN